MHEETETLPESLLCAGLFGTLRVQREGRCIDNFPTRQTALLFAYVTTYPRRHPRDELVDLLWPDADSGAGRPRLSLALWRLREILQGLCPASGRDALVADRNTVGIDTAWITSDVSRFRHLLQRAAKATGAVRVEALEQAVGLHGESGGFLPGFYNDWVLMERQRLLSDHLAALEALVSHHEKAGAWQRALAWAERAVAADPLLEDSHRTLIRVLAASGQTAAANRQYRDLTGLLARELNAEPSAATRALMAQVQRQDGASFPVSSLRVAPLPARLTTCHGRETLLLELGALIDDPDVRLITLLGPGGVGKTRLALELARGVAAQGMEAALVSLADIAEPRFIADAVANGLTPPRDAPPLQRIADALTAAPDAPPFLLVLDNAERLAEQTGATVLDLLTRVPRLRVLVTSQRSLGVSGGHEVTLTPLGLPRDIPEVSPAAAPTRGAATAFGDAPSVRLFLDRARSVRPDFPADVSSLADVARICQRLEGLPLAIELCAGWAQTLGPRQMLELLAQRFELLVSRRTDLPARHRTLRAVFEYGYLQLSETMREALLRLAWFRGGWTLAAAADVCAGGSVSEALTLLAQMRERSLIVAEETEAGDGLRYQMLESLRDFVVEKHTAAQAEKHRKAHAAYFARFVQETVSRLRGGEEDALWAACLEEEKGNVRAALEYLIVQRDAEPAWTVTASASEAWNTHGNARAAQEWTTRCLAKGVSVAPSGDGAPCRDGRLRARLLTAQAKALSQLSDYTASVAAAEQGLAAWRTLCDQGNARERTEGLAECLRVRGKIALIQDDPDRARVLFAEALPLARTIGGLSLALLLGDLSVGAMKSQDWAAASDHMAEALGIYRRLNHQRGIGVGLHNLGVVSMYRGDYAAARTLLQEAVSWRGHDRAAWGHRVHFGLACVERLDGRFAEALSHLAVAAEALAACGDQHGIAWCVKEMGHLATDLQQYALGLRLLACAEATRAAIGMSFQPRGPQDIERDRAAAWRSLGADDAAAHWTLGAGDAPEALLARAQTLLAECSGRSSKDLGGDDS